MAKSGTKRLAQFHKPVSRKIDNSNNREFADRQMYSDETLLPEFRRSWKIQQEVAQTSSSESSDFGNASSGVWYATYGTHVSRALMQRSGAEFMPEVVIGRDDRVRITNTREYPYGAICSLEITASTGRQFVGTGWLASNRTVVTAGHCLYMPEQGGWAKRIRVFPGRNGVDSGSEPISAASLHSVEGWTELREPAADYGAIQLNDEVEGSGHLGFVALKSKDLKKNLYHVAGYSADKPLGTLWGHVRPLKEIRDDVLYYETDTYGGNSGGPVFFRDDEDDIYVVGIHNYGDISGNSATRITETVFETIAEWVS